METYGGLCRHNKFGCKGTYGIYKRHCNGKTWCFIGVGRFPDRLKTATVKSLYEKGDKENIHNYQEVLFQAIEKKTKHGCKFFKFIKTI